MLIVGRRLTSARSARTCGLAAMSGEESINTPEAFDRRRLKGPFKLRGVSNLQNFQAQFQPGGRTAYRIQLPSPARWEPEHSNLGKARHRIAQQLQCFGAEAWYVEEDTSDVAARMGQAPSPTVRNRIGFQVHRNDWDNRCCTSRGTDSRRSGSGDGPNALLHQFLRQCRQSVELVIGVTGHDLNFGNL